MLFYVSVSVVCLSASAADIQSLIVMHFLSLCPLNYLNISTLIGLSQ